MCGICGQLNDDPGRPADRALLERMNTAMRHRGPDSDGYHLAENAGLAMRRLAIIDLQTGEQPIANEDHTVWVVLNGEIYNFPELRADLESRGHIFRTHTDTEVIVHLYEEEGADCVKRLRGMFAFAVWDSRRRQLVLARDRLGKKPLYYCEHDGAFLFASELKCLLEVPGLPRDINLAAIHHYLSLQYIPDPMTVLSSVHRLAPAHVLVRKEAGSSVKCYWDFSYEPKLTGSEGDLAAELRDRLREAVKMRLISDVPLGAHLSGGIDSTIVTALMAEMSSGPVKTFSIGFEEEPFSELPHARAVAQRYSTEHHEFVVGYGDVPSTLDALVRAFDEPFADASALPVYFLAQLTRNHVTVALNGDGGDETMGGYQRYRLDRFANAYARLPRFLTQRLVPALVDMLPEPAGVPIEANRIAGLKRLAQVAAISPKASIIRWGSFFSDTMKPGLWREEHLTHVEGLSSAAFLAAAFDAAPAASFLDRTLFTDISNYLPGDLLVKVDRMTMAHSLEPRSPFLDQDFVAWTARLPGKMKVRGGMQKALLKTAFGDAFPAGLLHRGKRGFGIPVGAWIRGPLHDWTRQTLCDPSARVASLFRASALDRLMEEHTMGRTDHGKRLWALLCLERWMRQYGGTV